ncbi:MAG: aromatic ring-hydroxylating dioxygenase subunit alpha [Ilumatobacteraceae bacterium]
MSQLRSVDPTFLRASADLLNQGRALPSRWYADPAIFEVELATVFAHGWTYACHESVVANPGDYVSGSSARTPYTVVRGTDEVLRAFLNVCRHRLYPVTVGCGSARQLRCQYHGWTFDLEGQLSRVPRSIEVDGEQAPNPFCRDDYGLVELGLEQWGPLVFVNPDRDAAPLADQLGFVATLAAERKVDLAVAPVERDETVVECNWKTFMDNVIECYHCPTIHPQLARDYNTNDVEMDDRPKAYAHVLRPFKDGCGLPDAETYYVWPNFFMSAPGSEGMLTLRADPVDVDHTRVITEYHIPASAAEETVQRRLAGSREIMQQDIDVAVAVQLGHRASISPPGCLLPRAEMPVGIFARTLLDEVGERAR